ncbi:MAG: hypothetical protein VKO21_11340 [Candidatus Sericytochromatia bacterium]|nr:hypothetical protein [Candidatus Sericytochromatia bacterium]
MIHVLWGEDDFTRRRWLAKQLDAWVPQELRTLNLETFEGPSASVQTVQSAVRTPSFFGERVVVIRRCGWFGSGRQGQGTGKDTKAGPEGAGQNSEDVEPKAADDRPPSPAEDSGKGKGGLSAEDKEHLVAWLKATTPEPGHLVLICTGKPGMNTQQGKALDGAAKAGRVKIIPFPGPNPFKPEEEVRWLQGHAREEGITLSPQVAETLVQRVGQIRAVLDQELRKLAAYAGDRAVTVDDVALLASSDQADVFAMLKAVQQGRLGVALRLADDLARRRHVLETLAAMGTVWRLHLSLKTLAAARVSQDETARILGIHPYRVQNDLVALRPWSLPALEQGLEALVTFELELKLGRADERRDLHLLLARLVALRGAGGAA